MRPALRNTLDFVLFQVCWFACVLGGAIDDTRVGVAATLLFLCIHTAVLTPSASRRLEMVGIVLFALFGVALEAGGVALGSLRFHDGVPRLFGLPGWMWSLWFLFPPLLDSTLRWLRGRLLLCIAFGAIGGPLAYLAGERLGALRLGEDRTRATLLIGALWAIYAPVVVAARARLCTAHPVHSAS